MNFDTLKSFFQSIINAIENTAIQLDQQIQKHLYRVQVTNFPKVQDVKGTVVVGNQKNVERQLQDIKKPLPLILAAIKAIAFPKSFEVTNFPKPEKYPEFPKSVEVSNFPPQTILKEIKVTNQPTLELLGIRLQLGKVEKAVKGLKLDPTITVEAPKPERVVVPPAQVTLNEKEIDYEKIAEAIAGKMPAEIDYKKMADAVGSKIASMMVVTGGGHSRSQSVDIRNANILTSFETNEVDKSDATYVYNGLEDKDGSWCVQRVDKSSGLSVRFASSGNNTSYKTFASAWTDRVILVYGYFSEAF